jgi:threonine/homoserine/homoserine lactone efflux protein
VPSLATLTAFVVIVAAFAAIPGPSNLYVVAEGLRGGRGAGLAAATGCALAAMVYVAATAAGLAALLASSAGALSALHYVAGFYLLMLGVRSLRTARGAGPAHDRVRKRNGRSLRQGFLVELGNPKVALFFLAFFPQFIRADRGDAWSQILVLGAAFCVVGLVSDSLYAIASGTLQAKLRGSARLRARSHRLSAAMYFGLAAWAIGSGSRARPG